MKLISVDNRESTGGALTLVSIASGVFSGLVGTVWTVAVASHMLGGLSVWAALGVVPLAILIGFGFGYVFYKGWHLSSSIYVDRVFDCGDHLLIDNNGASEKIDFDEIADITYSYMSPMRVTISTSNSKDEGSQVSFCPRNAFGVPELVRSLRERTSAG